MGQLLRALMASETMNPQEAMVHIATFGKVLDCLGPLDANFMPRIGDVYDVLCFYYYFI